MSAQTLQVAGELIVPGDKSISHRSLICSALAEGTSRVQSILRRALDIGFSLAELARFMRARERGGTPCREVRALAVRKLATSCRPRLNS